MYPSPTTLSLVRQKTEEILKGYGAKPLPDENQSKGEPFPGSSEWFARCEKVQTRPRTKSP